MMNYPNQAGAGGAGGAGGAFGGGGGGNTLVDKVAALESKVSSLAQAIARLQNIVGGMHSASIQFSGAGNDPNANQTTGGVAL